MTTAGWLRRRGRVGVLALSALPAMLLLTLALTVRPASAHAILEIAAPAQGSQVGEAPSDVRLTFSERVGVGARAVQVLDPQGRPLPVTEAVHADGDRTLRVGLPADLGNGSYTVVWRVVSADGHPASGTFTFGVGVPAGAAPPTVAVDPGVAAVRAVAQLISYAGTALLIGGSAFTFVLWRGGVTSIRLRLLLTVGCAVAGAGAVTSLLVQGPYVAGAGLDGLLDVGLLEETVSSVYGRPLILRVLAVLLAVPVLGIWPRVPDDGEDGGPGGAAAAGTLVLLVASFAFTGHAVEATPRLLAEAAVGIHHGAAGVWLGGLVVLVAAFLPEAGESERAAVLPRWSRTAMVCVALIALTGLYQAWREVRLVEALGITAYGRLVLGKLALVAVLLGLAVLARRAMARALSSGVSPSGVSLSVARLRSLVAAEAVLGLAVLGVTSFLVATPPARVTFGPPYRASLIAQDVEARAIRVAVDVAPTRVGAQTVQIQVSGAVSGPLPFVSATGRLRNEAGDLRLDLVFTQAADGRASAQVVVPSPGRWRLELHVLTDATTDYVATTTYTVR